MKKAEIKKGGVITNSNIAEEAELLAWIEQEKAKGSFGSNESKILVPVVVTPEIIDELGNVITPAVVDMVEEVIPADYEIEITDVTAIVESEAAIEAEERDIKKGIRAIAVFKARVKQKGLTVVQIGQLFSDPNISKIIAALSTGSIGLSVALVTSYQADGTLVTDQDKEAVIASLA